MIDFENGLELKTVLHKKTIQRKFYDDQDKTYDDTIFILELEDNIQSDKFFAEINEELFVMFNPVSELFETEFVAFAGFPILKNIRLCFLQPMDYFNDWHFLIMSGDHYDLFEKSKKELRIEILSREEEEKVAEFGKV